MIDLVHPKVNSTVLDLGCGTGNLTCILAERVGPGGGVDPDKERLHVAREKYSASNLSFLEGSSETSLKTSMILSFQIMCCTGS